MLEAIQLCQEISGRKLDWRYVEDNRKGDHIWWISDLSRFQSHYPEWKQVHTIPSILKEIYEMNVSRKAGGTLAPNPVSA
jgi:CDP-paratose 2-epimerase